MKENERRLWRNLMAIDAVYECPKDEGGKRLGPLVTYAGSYEPGKHWVGDVYANLAILERDAKTLRNFSVEAYELFKETYKTADVFCGIPEGGRSFATLLAALAERDFCYPERENVAGSREKVMKFLRHDDALEGKKVILVEDVMNNFSSTEEMIELVRAAGGTPIAITGILNRSLSVRGDFMGLPVLALIDYPIMQYRQDDQAVADDIIAGNVVLKPKFEWPRLKAAMEAA
jgi:orotate phosphoribosyltransferase